MREGYFIMTLRLFAGLPVPDFVADQFEPFMKGIKGAKWRTRAHYHITLAFFGSVNERQAEALDDELAQIDQTPFELRLKGAGHFGRTDPHQLWLGVDDVPPLMHLAARVERRARRLGFELEKRAYKPHLTLAYLKNVEPEKLIKFEREMNLFHSKPFMVDRFYLYSSWSHEKGGNSYEIEAEYPLHHKLLLG